MRKRFLLLTTLLGLACTPTLTGVDGHAMGAGLKRAKFAVT